MVAHHPNNNLLLEHSAGALDQALSLSVAAHIQMCAQCRQQIHHLNCVGGCLLECTSPGETPAGAYKRLMIKIGQHEHQNPRLHSTHRRQTPAFLEKKLPVQKEEANPVTDEHRSNLLSASLPSVLQKLLRNSEPLHWKAASPSLQVAHVASDYNDNDIALCKLNPGGKIARHNHRGIEVTLLLSGHLSDINGLYAPGDFVMKQAGEIHGPTATQDQPCIYLSVTQAPAITTGIMGWLSQTFHGFKSA